ncbi:membrane protein [Mycobacterium tuberculosis]
MRDILEGSTGEFKDKYGKSSAHLRQLLADNRVATHGTVVAASVKSATTNKVVVLMFIDQSVSNRNSPTPQIDRSRIKVIMDKVNGRWLASKVELL